MFLARARFRNQSGPFLRPRIKRTPFGTRFHSAGTRTPWRALPAPIAEAHFGDVPREIAAEVEVRLDLPLRGVLERFQKKFGKPREK